MLSKREQLLLYVFLFLVAIVLFFVARFLLFGNNEEIVRAIQKDVAKIENFKVIVSPLSLKEKLSQLEERFAAIKPHFYAADEMDIYHFGNYIRGLLKNRGLTITRYQVASSEKNLLEFVVEGTHPALFQFLQQVSYQEKYIKIPHLRISAKSSSLIEASFRIGYEVVD